MEEPTEEAPTTRNEVTVRFYADALIGAMERALDRGALVEGTEGVRAIIRSLRGALKPTDDEIRDHFENSDVCDDPTCTAENFQDASRN